MRDEAEIRGHRRTYIGALPGQIIQGLRRAESKNPVFILDEIDKLGSDFRGDPSSALLEVLDPEQNNTFRDHYLDVPFDLSEVLFITTANVLDPIPAALRDRMEVLEIAGYTEEEKLKIAVDHLVDKQVKNHGLTAEYIQFTAGRAAPGHPRLHARGRRPQPRARDRRRSAARSRGAAPKGTRRRSRSRPTWSSSCSARRGSSTRRWRSGPRIRASRSAWPGRAAGGEVLFIEASRMAGGGSLTLTGQLGDVMKESARAALSWLRAHAKTYGIDPDFFTKAEMHVHVPAGAIPKDGPSAGVTMATAMASALTGRPVRGDIAMTGEITLSGRVLPIGGVKEKVLAARRLGIHEVIVPKQNAKNINEDLTPELREGLTVHLVSTIDEVLALALQPVASDVRPLNARTVGQVAAPESKTATTSADREHAARPVLAVQRPCVDRLLAPVSASISGRTSFPPASTRWFTPLCSSAASSARRLRRARRPPAGTISRWSTPPNISRKCATARCRPRTSRSSSCRGRRRWSTDSG